MHSCRMHPCRQFTPTVLEQLVQEHFSCLNCSCCCCCYMVHTCCSYSCCCHSDRSILFCCCRHSNRSILACCCCCCHSHRSIPLGCCCHSDRSILAGNLHGGIGAWCDVRCCSSNINESLIGRQAGFGWPYSSRQYWRVRRAPTQTA